MDTPIFRLKLLLSESAHDAGARWGSFRRTYDVDELFNSVLLDKDSPGDIAAKALCHLCASDRGFNGNTVGLKAALRFLAICSEDDPSDLAATADCLRSLKEALDAQDARASVRRWVREWFRL